MKLLSLCTGYGGLDLAVEQFFNAQLLGCADIDKSANIAIEQRFGVPNYGDIKTLIGTNLEFDILTAGYPCQPFSHAGQRKGTDDPRHIWPYIAQIISHSRPRIVVLENVRGHLSLGFSEVLKDLAQIGYAAKWTIVRASDVGAPHQRARLFIIAYPDTETHEQPRRADRAISSKTSQIKYRSNRHEYGSGSEDITDTNSINRRVSFQDVGNTNDQQLPPDRQMSQLGWRFDSRSAMSMREVPHPLVDGKLNTRFVEYMMGLPTGWVTDLPLSRAQQFKLLGNGVVPQQAYYALELLWRHAV
jgi:DNA (cytosine-5)-methyltransferase 1